jgi:hypothetical protein
MLSERFRGSGQAGNVCTYSGSQWTGASGIAGGSGYSVGTWAQGILVQDNYTFTALSCPAVYVCGAVDNDGNAYTFTEK